MKTRFFAFLILLISLQLSAQWSLLKTPAPYVNSPTNYLASYNNVLWAATNQGIAYSNDNGATWVAHSNSLGAGASFRELAFTPYGIYIRTTTMGLLRTMDSGATLKTDTAGITISAPFTMEMYSLFYDKSSYRLFTSNYNGYYTKKAGDYRWNKISGLGTSHVWGTVKANGKYYAATENGIYASTDALNWTKLTGTSFPNVSSIPGGPSPLVTIGSELYYGLQGVSKSSDGGQTWTRIDKNFAKYSGTLIITGLYYDGTRLYAAVRSNNNSDSVYVSNDNGANWNDMSEGPLHTWLLSFTTHNGKLYAAGYGQDSIFFWKASGSGILPVTVNDSKVSIYPNPAIGIVHISVNGHTIQNEVIISDLSGRVLLSKKLTNDGYMDVSALSPGIYSVSVVSDGSVCHSSLFKN